MADWRSVEQLKDHFAQHGREMGFRTADEYDASVQETLSTGVYFTYFEPAENAQRIGCFNHTTGKFVVLTDDDERIVSHFITSVRYIRRLPYNNYDE